MVKFKYVNEVYMYIDAETSVKYEMNDYFKFRVPGYQFMPAFKNRSWDGYIFIYKLNTSLLPIGLFEVAIRFCIDNGYEYEIDDSILGNDVSYASIETYMNKLNIHSSGEAITPYDFQVKAVHKVAEANKALILSATGSGKSLIAYSSIRYHLDNTDRAKILLIVPTVSLVEQMYSDFVDYSSANGFDVEANCHKVKAGKPKGTRKSVTISTWQSIFKENAHFFRDFTMIIGDECLHPDTQITMDDGSSKSIVDISVGDIIKTVNELTGYIELQPVLEVHKNISLEPMLKLKLDDTVVRITGNHKVLLTNGKWVRADNIKIGDEINSISVEVGCDAK